MLIWLSGIIASIVLLSYAISWVIYWRKGDERVFYGPVDCWIGILTGAPCLVLAAGVVVPAAIGFYGLQQCGFSPTINMDFASYLAVDLQVQFLYDCIQDTIKEEEAKRGNGRELSKWSGWHFPQVVAANILQESTSEGHADGRRLKVQSKPWRNLEIFYQAVDSGAGIFTEKALTEIHLFEELVQSFRNYNEYCLLEDGLCKGPASPTAFFFEPRPDSPNEWTLRDINTTLRAMLRDGILTAFTDKDFNALNLKSGYTRASFQGGVPLQGYTSWKERWSEQLTKHKRFLVELFEEVLSHADASGADKLPFQHVVFTWYEPSLKVYEVNKWLFHDALWCAGTFAAVTILMVLNIRSIFLTIFGLLGVLLAFAATFFFHYVVMGYITLTVLDFLSLFLIVGIAADDIFIMCHTFYLAPAVLGDHATPGDCMKWAYKQAGEAMLVTTATTAGSFYANCVSVLIVVKQFGFFMGTLVVWNYINVMVILPASLLVLELYVVPCIRFCLFCCRRNTFAAGLREEAKVSDPDPVGLAVIPECSEPGQRDSVGSYGTPDGGCKTRATRNSWRTTITSAFSVQSRTSAVKRLSTMADRVQSQLVTNVRTLASRATFQVVIHRDLDLEKLSGIERLMHDRVFPMLLRRRACWLLTSLALSALGGWLAVSGFTLAKGDLQIFPESVNAGRLERLRKEVFTSEDLMEIEVMSSSVPSIRIVNSPVTGNAPIQCPGINTSCSGRGVCDSSTRSCTCGSHYVGPGCSLERKNSTFEILPKEVEVVKLLADPSIEAVAEEVAEEHAVWMTNDGDDSTTWNARVLTASPWLKLRMPNGYIGPRDFNGDDSVSSKSAVSFFVNFAGKSAGWAAVADVAVSMGVETQEVNFKVHAEVRSPPAVSIFINSPCQNCYMEPPFSLASGYPNPIYKVHVPYNITAASLHFQRVANEKIWTDAAASLDDRMVQQLPTTGVANVSVQVTDQNRSANYSLEFHREMPQPAPPLHLHRAVAMDRSIEVIFGLPDDLPPDFEGIAATANSADGLLSLDYEARPCQSASCWDWSTLTAFDGSCCLMHLVNLTNDMDWTFEVHLVGAGVAGLPSVPTVGQPGGWPALTVSAMAVSPSFLSAPRAVTHHGFVELLVVDSQVDAGGRLPLGLLRCVSSPGGLQSRDYDSSYASAHGEWRTVVRGLDTSLQYTFTCSISNSGQDPPTADSVSSSSLPTPLVQPAVEAPQPPDIMFLEWTFDAPAPTVRLRVHKAYPDEVWCSATVEGDALAKMEGYAVVPRGETAAYLDLLVVLQAQEIAYTTSAMKLTVSCKSQICDVGLGGSGCLWGPPQVTEYLRPSAPFMNVTAGDDSFRVLVQSSEEGQLQISCNAEGRRSAAATQTVNTTQQSDLGPLHLEELVEGGYLVSCWVRKMDAAFSQESLQSQEVEFLGQPWSTAPFGFSPRILAVAPAGEGALRIVLAELNNSWLHTSQDVMYICTDLSGNFSAISATSEVLVRGLTPGWPYSFTCVSYVDGDGFSLTSEASVSTLAARRPDAPSITAIAPGDSELSIFLSLPTSSSATGFAPLTGLACGTSEMESSLDLTAMDNGSGLVIRLPGINGIPMKFHCFVKSAAGSSVFVLDVATPGLPVVAGYGFGSTAFSQSQLRHRVADALGVQVTSLTLNAGSQRQGVGEAPSNNTQWTVQVAVGNDADPAAPVLAKRMMDAIALSKLSDRLQTSVEANAARIWSSSEIDSTLRELAIFEIPQQRRVMPSPYPAHSGHSHYAQVASKRFSVLAVTRSPLASVRLNGGIASQVFEIRRALPFMENVSVDVVSADGLIRNYLLSVGAPARSCEGNCFNGTCDDVLGQCVCQAGWTGSNCEDHCPGFPPCGGEESGRCLEWKEDLEDVANVVRRRCVCNAGYGGDDCSQPRCPECLNGGTCIGAAENQAFSSCQCPPNASGISCETLRCPGNCSGAGNCDATTGHCSCWLGASGESCNVTEATPEPLTNSVDVSLIWGIKGPRPENKSLPDFNADFDFLEPQVQSWILDMCQMAKNQTLLLARTDVPCWIESWKAYVEAVGGQFPVVPRSLAAEALTAFFHQDVADLFLEDIGMTEDKFSGHASFVVVRFFVNLPKNDGLSKLQAVRNQWGKFVKDSNRNAPVAAGEALMISQAWTKTEMEETILSNTGMSFFLSIGIAVASVIAFSQNVVIGFYVLLTIILEVCPLFGFLFGVVGYEFGAIEAVGSVIFVGMSVDYCLHMAHGYHAAPRYSRRDKMQMTLVNLGPSILGGAFTTAAATVFLLPCRVVLFVKLGTMLVANTILSLLYTYFFLAPLLLVAGPLEDTGSFSWLAKKGLSWCICSRPREDVYLRQEEGAAPAAFQDSRTSQLPSRVKEGRSILRQSSAGGRRTQVRFDPVEDVEHIAVNVRPELSLPRRSQRSMTTRISQSAQRSSRSSVTARQSRVSRASRTSFIKHRGVQEKASGSTTRRSQIRDDGLREEGNLEKMQ